jgi:hypothetical protein
VEVGLWAGNLAGGGSTGTTQFDWVEIVLGVPAGDFNEDGFVNAADYTVWRNTVNTSVTPWSGADGNGDGMVTRDDYSIWKVNYGKSAMLGTGATIDLAVVPEPGSMILAFLVVTGCGLQFPRRRLAPQPGRAR